MPLGGSVTKTIRLTCLIAQTEGVKIPDEYARAQTKPHTSLQHLRLESDALFWASFVSLDYPGETL